MSDSENNKTETTSTNPPSPERVTVAPTDPAQLALAVRNQVEYYFSKENLKNDSFLISKMDAQNSVAISTILTFAKLKALTEDESVVLEALKGSTTVSIVDGRLKSAVKQGRNTIILREISADTSEEDIREIFNYPGCKPITSVKSDIGDTWFVVFESEADAKDVVLDLKLKKRMFGGAAVKARLKSEAVVNRSYYPTTPPIASSIYPVMYPYGGAGGQQQFGASYGGNQMAGGGAESSGSGSPQGRGEQEGGGQTKGNVRSDRGGGETSRGDRRVTGGKANGGNNNRENNSNSRGNSDTNSRKGNSNNNSSSNSSGNNNTTNNGSNNSKGGASSRESGSQRSSPRDTPAIEINSLNFPPLAPGGEEVVVSPSTTTTPTTTAAAIVAASIIPPAPASESNSTTPVSSVINANTASFTPAAVATTPVVAAATSTEDFSIIGYGDKPFMKYQIDDITNVVKNIKEAILPDTIHTTQHPLAMETTPNVDLLLRQRTFSIDETREQMQQGRPVQRDAVISGEVDYNSVMYGDEGAANNNTAGASTNTTTATTSKVSVSQKKKVGGSWAGVLKSAASTPPPASTAPGASATAAKGPAGKPPSGPPAKSGAGAGATAGNKSGEGSGKKGEAGKKGGASSGKSGNTGNKSSEKKDGRNGNNRDQRGGSGGRGRQDQKDKESAVPSGPPLKWGDKPSFANVLKAKEDNKAPADSPAKVQPQTQTVPRGQRSRSGSESSNGGGKQVVTGEDGTWSKQKLPPLKKNEP